MLLALLLSSTLALHVVQAEETAAPPAPTQAEAAVPPPRYARPTLGIRTQYPLIRDIAPAVGTTEFQSLPPVATLVFRYESDLGIEGRNLDAWAYGALGWTLLSPAPYIQAAVGISGRYRFWAASLAPELLIQNAAYPSNNGTVSGLRSVFAQTFFAVRFRSVFHISPETYVHVGMRYVTPFHAISSTPDIGFAENTTTYLKTRSLWVPSVQGGVRLPLDFELKGGLDLLIPESATLASDQFKVDLNTDLAIFRAKWTVAKKIDSVMISVSGSHLLAPSDGSELPYRMPQVDEDFALSAFNLALEVAWVF